MKKKKELDLPRVAILASGNGTTAEVYAEAIHEGLVSSEIGLVVTNNPDAGILDKVLFWNDEFGFHTEAAVINEKTHKRGGGHRGQTDSESEAIADLIDEHNIELVALLGYMKIVRGAMIERFGFNPKIHKSIYQAKMINTHPGPLPETADTYGEGASQRVLDLGKTVSQHTVHVVSAKVDKGPIFRFHDVPVEPDDTAESLFKRVQEVEKANIAYDIDDFIHKRSLDPRQVSSDQYVTD